MDADDAVLLRLCAKCVQMVIHATVCSCTNMVVCATAHVNGHLSGAWVDDSRVCLKAHLKFVCHDGAWCLKLWLPCRAAFMISSQP